MRAEWKSALLLGLFSTLAGAQPVETLVERALSTNRDYLAGLERVREAKALVGRAGVRPAPAIETEGGSTRLLGSPGSYEYSIGYIHTLETGGKRGRRLDVARLGLQLAKAEVEERRRQLTLDVRRRWAEALDARNRLSVLAEIARIGKESLRLISARVEEGDAAPLEKQLLETEINRGELDRLRAEAKADSAILGLKQIGAIADSAASLDGTAALPPVLPARDELVRGALESRPDLRLLRLAEEQARAGVELAQAESTPNIGASARYAYRSNTFDQSGFNSAGVLTPVRDRESVLTFGVSVPLFSRRNNQANVEASVAREREARLRREHLAAAIPSEVAAALRKCETARAALDAYDRSILPQSEKNLNVIRQAWQLGQLRFMDVLNEQRRLTDLRLARVDAETELLNAWADLAYATGGDIR